MAQKVKSLPMARDPLEKGMATHSSILAWKIPWTEEPDGLQSTGCKESDTTERLDSQRQLGTRKEGWPRVVAMWQEQLQVPVTCSAGDPSWSGTPADFTGFHPADICVCRHQPPESFPFCQLLSFQPPLLEPGTHRGSQPGLQLCKGRTPA